jgi:hypothetical protein
MQVAVRSAIAVLVVSVLAVVASVLPAAAQTTGTPAPSVATGAATTAPSAGDTQSSRTVNRIVLALLALAALLLVLAVWLWRTTKPVPSHLDGLDAMGTRRWRNASGEDRASMLAPAHARRSDLRDEELIAPADDDLVAANTTEAAANPEQVPDDEHPPVLDEVDPARPPETSTPEHSDTVEPAPADAEAPSTPLA